MPLNHHIVIQSQPVLARSYPIVMGVMKMGSTVPRAGLEPRSLAFRASVLPLHHIGFPDITTMPTPTCLCSSLHQRSVHTTTLLMTSDRLGSKKHQFYITILCGGVVRVSVFFSKVRLLIWRLAVWFPMPSPLPFWILTDVYNLQHHQRSVGIIPCLYGVVG